MVSVKLHVVWTASDDKRASYHFPDHNVTDKICSNKQKKIHNIKLWLQVYYDSIVLL